MCPLDVRNAHRQPISISNVFPSVLAHYVNADAMWFLIELLKEYLTAHISQKNAHLIIQQILVHRY